VFPKGKSTPTRGVIYGALALSLSLSLTHLAPVKIVLQVYFKNLELLAQSVEYRFLLSILNHRKSHLFIFKNKSKKLKLSLCLNN
jgi:hypothetical protein